MAAQAETPKERVNVTMDVDLVQRLKIAAAANRYGISVSQMVSTAVREHLDALEKEKV